MNEKGGYRHGMFTLLVPPELAQPIARNAKALGVSEREIMLSTLRMAVHLDFLTDALEYELPPTPKQ